MRELKFTCTCCHNLVEDGLDENDPIVNIMIHKVVCFECAYWFWKAKWNKNNHDPSVKLLVTPDWHMYYINTELATYPVGRSSRVNYHGFMNVRIGNKVITTNSWKDIGYIPDRFHNTLFKVNGRILSDLELSYYIAKS